MDADSGMNQQFAKRLRRQQLCSPSRVVLHETHNTTPVPATPRPNHENLRPDVTPRDAINTGALELLERKAQVQRWLFPPTLDTPPPSEQDKLSEPDVEEGNSCDSWLSFPSSSSSCSTPHKQILEERLSTPDIAPPPLFKISVGHTVNVSADRYIPARSPGNWSTRFSMIPDDCTTRSPPKKIRNKKTDLKDKDNDVYSSLLRNELLGSNIGSLKPHSVSSPKRKNLFRYSMSIENEQNIESTAPYTSWSVSSHSQRLLRSSHKAFRQISKIPFKVLDAPDLEDDFYLNLVDWSSQNVLSVGLGSCVYLWSAPSGKVTRLCNLTCENNKVTSVAWSERGNYLAVGTHGGQVQVWDVCEAKRVSMLGVHRARVSTMAWSGDLLSSGGRDSVILQRDIRTPQHSHGVRRLSGHSQEVCGLKWSPDSQYLASGGNENRLNVWSIHSLRPVQTYTEHQAAVKAIAWSPHHHGLLASGGGTADRCIRFWNTLTGQPMQCVDTGSQVCNLAWSKHSSELVSTHGYPCNPIQVWKYPSMRPVAKLTGHSQRVSYLAVAPDGEAIVTGSGDETLRFWKVFTKDKFLMDNKSTLNLFSNIR